MDVSRPAFPSPVICLDGFLADGDARQVLAECQQMEASFVAASINDRAGGERIDRGYRSNTVLYSSSLRLETSRLLRQRIWADDCKRLWHEGEYVFDIINSSTWQGCVVSRYGNGDFYKLHRDTIPGHAGQRLVTLVYYVNREPERFSGGRLILHKRGRTLELAPRHNRAVVFPSFTQHRVEPVCMDDSAGWADSRFSVNYWIGFR